MDTAPVKINVDPDVFKLKDASVTALATGALSLERLLAFSNSHAPYMLVGDTLYALTEAEYYALVPGIYKDNMTPEAFKWALDTLLAGSITDVDKGVLVHIENTYKTCSKCTYRHYRDVLSNLLHRYNIDIPTDLSSRSMDTMEDYKYAGTTEHIEPKVSSKLDFKVDIVPKERAACLDCVEKHASQALILGTESILGYADHLMLACGHLEEALAETPEEAKALKQTLVFCLGKTKHDKSLFLPIESISILISKARESIFSAKAMDTASGEEEPAMFELDYTEEMMAELKALPDDVAVDCQLLLLKAAGISALETVTESARLTWEGAMATSADYIAQLAPKAANMLRNRRLLFVSDPRLLKESGFGLDPVIEALKR